MPAIQPRVPLAAAALLSLVSLAASSSGAQVVPDVAAAVGSDSLSAFVVLVRGDTLGVERFVHTRERLAGELTLRGQPRVAYDIALAGPGRTRHMALSVYAPGASPQAPPVQRLLLRPAGDSVAVDVAAGGNPPRTQRMAIAPDAVLALGNAFATLDLVVDRARDVGGDSVQVPVFLASGGQQVTTVRLVSADSAVLVIGGVEIHFASRDGRTTRVTVPAQSVVATRLDGTTAATVALDRPDYTAPAGAPYTAVDVRIPTADGDTLAGTLTMPAERRGRRVPAVITISGSGAQDRDEALPGITGYRPFRQIADTLGRRGVAVLRLDDRGFGASTGSFTAATSADFAADVRAALAWLRARPDVDPARVFLLGHSEGAMIAPMVAADDQRLAGVVLLAGPSWTGRRTLDYQIRYAVEQDSTIAPAARAGAITTRLATLDSLTTRQPWLRYFADHDPLAIAARVRVPALIVQGATDRQVPAEQAEELAAALRKGGERDVTVRILPDRNHLLLPDRDGNPAGYGELTQRQLGADVLGPIVDWIVKRASSGGA